LDHPAWDIGRLQKNGVAAALIAKLSVASTLVTGGSSRDGARGGVFDRV